MSGAGVTMIANVRAADPLPTGTDLLIEALLTRAYCPPVGL